MNPIIEVNNVSKVFPARRGPRVLSGRGGVGDWLTGRRQRTFTALKDISLTVAPGESLGIIGRNGSGKSTLLSIIAGVTLPTTGRVFVRGRVASLLELGAGFSPILTGRENIYLNAGLMGMRHAQVDEVFDEIVRFSGIETFIDQPVETYSSGMYVRIGFAVAVHTNPDIFLADEVLAVGDAEFQRRCRTKIGELREQGKTIVFVSHDLGIVNTLCERVILLDQGQMIQRETPQKTITYYLRQVGMEKSVHTFGNNELEAIHCDGRISLFQQEEEISAPAGFTMLFSSLGQEHHSADASWEVVERRTDGCRAEGRMMRMPVQLAWTLTLEGKRLRWRADMVCEREAPIATVAAHLYLPAAYTRWVYGGLTGVFPEISPTDAGWTKLVAPEDKATDTAALPAPDTALPPLVFHLERHNPYFGFFWANTEYTTFSRALCVFARYPEHNNIFAKGEHALFEITVDAGISSQKVMEHVCANQVVRCGSLSARFEHGQIRLLWEDVELTTFMHLYASMLIEHLWNDSQSLQWGEISAIKDGIRLRGVSRRFPFLHEWEMWRAERGVGLRIWLETTEALEVQEYHTTIVTPSLYDRWQTDLETGVFPEYDPMRSNWTHCNRSYAPGRRITALSNVLPSITMALDDECPEMRMTPINTSYQEHARALQALRPSETGRLYFAQGRHLYFSGVITVAPNDTVSEKAADCPPAPE